MLCFQWKLAQNSSGHFGTNQQMCQDQCPHSKCSILQVKYTNRIMIRVFIVELIGLMHGVNHWYQFDCNVSNCQNTLVTPCLFLGQVLLETCHFYAFIPFSSRVNTCRRKLQYRLGAPRPLWVQWRKCKNDLVSSVLCESECVHARNWKN